MKIKELLTDSSKWTKDTPARDKNGIQVQPTDPNAVSWCLIGAIEKCYPKKSDQYNIIALFLAKVGFIANWNDDHTRTFADISKLVQDLDI